MFYSQLYLLQIVNRMRSFPISTIRMLYEAKKVENDIEQEMLWK